MLKAKALSQPFKTSSTTLEAEINATITMLQIFLIKWTQIFCFCPKSVDGPFYGGLRGGGKTYCRGWGGAGGGTKRLILFCGGVLPVKNQLLMVQIFFLLTPKRWCEKVRNGKFTKGNSFLDAPNLGRYYNVDPDQNWFILKTPSAILYT